MCIRDRPTIPPMIRPIPIPARIPIKLAAQTVSQKKIAATYNKAKMPNLKAKHQ